MAKGMAEIANRELFEVTPSLPTDIIGQLTSDVEALGTAIPSKISLELSTCWSNLPYSMLGLLGRRAGVFDGKCERTHLQCYG